MLISVVLSFIPIMPGPALVWAIAIVFGFFTEFTRLTPLAAIMLTLIMIVASTSDVWLPLFGMRASGVSCQSTIGGFIGGLIGTFAIPIPILGTLVGMVLGALAVEFIHLRDVKRAYSAGRAALNAYLLSYVVQLLAVFVMFGIYVWSLLATG